MGRLILVEGLDLAGKSTLSRALAAHFAGEGQTVTLGRNFLCQENPMRQAADELIRDPERTAREVTCLLQAAHHWDVRNFKPVASVHIQDSCWLRSHSWDLAHGRDDAGWRSAPTVKFDQVLFLTASLEARRERYVQRAANDAGDYEIFSRPRHFLHLERALRQIVMRLPGAIQIDTTELSADQVLQVALAACCCTV